MIRTKKQLLYSRRRTWLLCRLLLLREMYEPGVMVSRDHPFIAAAGRMGAWSAGGSCSTSTVGSAQETSHSPANVSPFTCNPNGFLRTGFTASETANESDRLSQHTCESKAGESSSNTCLVSTPQSRYVESIPISES